LIVDCLDRERQKTTRKCWWKEGGIELVRQVRTILGLVWEATEEVEIVMGCLLLPLLTSQNKMCFPKLES
jgi:hypothetical protein